MFCSVKITKFWFSRFPKFFGNAPKSIFEKITRNRTKKLMKCLRTIFYHRTGSQEPVETFGRHFFGRLLLCRARFSDLANLEYHFPIESEEFLIFRIRGDNRLPVFPSGPEGFRQSTREKLKLWNQ